METFHRVIYVECWIGMTYTFCIIELMSNVNIWKCRHTMMLFSQIIYWNTVKVVFETWGNSYTLKHKIFGKGWAIRWVSSKSCTVSWYYWRGWNYHGTTTFWMVKACIMHAIMEACLVQSLRSGNANMCQWPLSTYPPVMACQLLCYGHVSQGSTYPTALCPLSSWHVSTVLLCIMFCLPQ